MRYGFGIRWQGTAAPAGESPDGDLIDIIPIACLGYAIGSKCSFL